MGDENKTNQDWKGCAINEPDNCLKTTWWLPDNYQASAWKLPDICLMTSIWQLDGYSRWQVRLIWNDDFAQN